MKSTLLTLALSVLSYRCGCTGVISEGMVKAPACERHHVVMDPVNETLWTFHPYILRRHELRLLNPQDNVELLIPGQMLCVKALEKAENYGLPSVSGNYMENWSRIVSIEVTAHATKERKYCTGTFLDERTVITTASCVFKTSEENVKVVLRDTSELRKLSNAERRGKPVPTSKARVGQIATHPEYLPETGQSHNLAVLFLKERTKFEDTSRKLELPAEGAEKAEKTESVKVTYVAQRNYWWQGYTLENGTEGINRSRTELRLSIDRKLIPVDAAKCREMFWAQGYDDFFLSEDMLCTVMDPDEYFDDVCHAGNGAALVVFDEGLQKYFITGIAVATSGDCTELKRAHDYIFVDLRHKSNLEWLQKTIQL